jgi:hypothetical protein
MYADLVIETDPQSTSFHYLFSQDSKKYLSPPQKYPECGTIRHFFKTHTFLSLKLVERLLQSMIYKAMQNFFSLGNEMSMQSGCAKEEDSSIPISLSLFFLMAQRQRISSYMVIRL